MSRIIKNAFIANFIMHSEKGPRQNSVASDFIEHHYSLKGFKNFRRKAKLVYYVPDECQTKNLISLLYL